MITVLDFTATALWRASWQATALAILIVILLRCFGERLAPRWRYLLWSVVVLRLLFVTTPASPWSAFNFIG
jgi:beta-lactamase regulating signal transducer with metallopeptidase domain